MENNTADCRHKCRVWNYFFSAADISLLQKGDFGCFHNGETPTIITPFLMCILVSCCARMSKSFEFQASGTAWF